MRLPAALSVLRNPRFRLYWIGQSISLTGTWMQIMAQGWVLTRLSSAAVVLGILNVVGALPILLLSVYAGHLADRGSKRRILLVTQFALMMLAFALAYLAFSGRIALWHIFALAFVSGIATAFDLPAAQALPAELVEPAEIPRVVALMQAVFHGSRLVGPALAGLLMAQLGEGSAFFANGVSFIAVIATLIAIGDATRARRAPRPGSSGGMGAGFRYIRSEPLARGLVTLTALTTSLVFPLLIVLLLYYVRHVLKTDARGLGLLMSVSGLGSLTGAMALLFARDETLKRWLLTGILGIGITMTGIAVSRTLPVALPFMLVLSFCVSSFMGRIAQTIQHQVPDELRGRVMAVYGMAFTGLLPYAALLAAFLTDKIGFQMTILLSVGLYVIGALTILARLPAPQLHGSPTSLAMLLLGAMALALGPKSAIAAEPRALEQQWARVVSEAGGSIGVAALHLESGERAGIGADARFPMASVYKFPIAVAVLDEVDAGRLRLDSLVQVEASDLRLGASPIATRHPSGGVRLSISDLLAGMLVESDNTACDLLLNLSGGPAVVTARARARGCKAMRIDRSEGEILFDVLGIESAPAPDTWTLPRLQALAAAVPKPQRARAAAAFRADPRDTTTPADLVTLLAAVMTGNELDVTHRTLLFDWMERSTTGPRRLRGRLPAGTRVAHKTGTIGTVVNDAGIVTLPGDRGRIAIAVLTMNVPGGTPAAERAIAQLARAAYDHWGQR